MRFLMAYVAGFLTASVVGCGHKQPPVQVTHFPAGSTQPASSKPTQGVAITPESGLFGKVAQVNPNGRFVVLSFPVSQMPALERRLYVYRGSLRVGEISVSGPQLDDNIVADILSGEAAIGDLVRDK